MKRFWAYAVVSAVVFTILLVLLTKLFGGAQPWGYYVVVGILYGLVSGAFNYLQEKRKKDKEDK